MDKQERAIKYKENQCPNCGEKDVELEQCEYCLNLFCINCIDEHKLICPEKEVL